MTADERDLAWIVERVRSHYDATAIYLFGSHAKETPRPGSDIDLLIIGRSRLPACAVAAKSPPPSPRSRPASTSSSSPNPN